MLVQTSLIQSLIQQWAAKPSMNPATSASSGASLSTLPVELIELVLAHVDSDTLFKLCRVNRLLRALAQPRLMSHAQQITMRLWIHQPHVVSHKPIDFGFSHCDNDRMVFAPQEASPMMLQTALPPPQIDGCTILIKVSNTRRIYSISYKDRMVAVPVQQGQHVAEYVSNSDARGYVEDAYQCGWHVAYTIIDDAHNPMLKRLVPQSFACDTDLLDPQVLIASSREKVVVSLPEPVPETQDQHDEKKKMMEAAAHQAAPSWLSRIVNDTMASFYQWLSL
ncbi:hypothetical protein BJV82DRAFT_604056 [Fennellomyces sp. T-0311]|nr:hypothetical protein BJV82DRAFT_604056 [Fennellomyces sp. T-0311]